MNILQQQYMKAESELSALGLEIDNENLFTDNLPYIGQRNIKPSQYVIGSLPAYVLVPRTLFQC